MIESIKNGINKQQFYIKYYNVSHHLPSFTVDFLNSYTMPIINMVILVDIMHKTLHVQLLPVLSGFSAILTFQECADLLNMCCF